MTDTSRRSNAVDSTPDRIPVVILAPIAVVASALGSALERGGMNVVATCDLGEVGTSRCQQFTTSVVLLDASSDACARTARLIRSAVDPDRLVLFGLSETNGEAGLVADLGIRTLLGEGATLEETLIAIAECAGGRAFVSSGLAVGALRQKNIQAPEACLTKRELQVAILAAASQSNEAIGDYLGVRMATVRNHLHSVYTKLGIHDRRHLTALFSRHSVDAPIRSSGGI